MGLAGRMDSRLLIMEESTYLSFSQTDSSAGARLFLWLKEYGVSGLSIYLCLPHRFSLACRFHA